MSFTYDSLSGLWFGDIDGLPTEGSPLPARFVARRAYEGPQNYVEWDLPPAGGLVAEMKLVRRLNGFPRTFTDPLATVLWSGPVQANTYSDMAVTSETTYYYKLFCILIDGTVVSSALHQGLVITLPTGFFAEKLWALTPEFDKNADKRKDLNYETKRALVEGSGATEEVFNLGEDGSLAKGQLRRFLKVFGPLFDEAKGLIDVLINQLDFDASTITNLTFLAQTLGLDLNTELSPEKARNEARQQIAYLKLKGTKPGLIARLRSVSDAQPTITEQFNNILISNDPDRTSLKFDAAEVQGINSPNDVIFRSVGYPDVAPFWLWFNVFMDLADDLPLDEVTVRKWCIAMNESSPACHRGDLYVTGTTQDPAKAIVTDTALDDEEDQDLEPAVVSVANSIVDSAVYNVANTLIYSDPLKTFNAPNFGAIFPGIPAPYITPPTSG